MVVEYAEDAPRQMQLSPTQWNFIQDDHRFIVFVSGRFCGKTTSATWRLMSILQRPEYRGARVLVLGPTYPQMKGGTLVTFDEWFIDKANLVLEKKDGNEPERLLKNDVKVLFRNASNLDQTRGHEYAIVWMDEAGQMAEETLRLANACTRQRRPDGTFYPRQTIITTTPRGKNWIYRTFKDQASPKFLGPEIAGVYETTTLEAQKYGIADPEYVQQSGYREGTEEYNQEILGQYVSWGGNVFNTFDAKRHYDSTYAPPTFEYCYAGVDVGLSSPTAIEVSGMTSSGKIITFKEYYQTNARADLWMPQLRRWQTDFNIRRVYVDSAFPREIATLKGMGVQAYPSMKKSDAAGTAVSFMNTLFANNRLLLMAVPNLRREIENYEFKERMSGDESTFLDKVKPNQDDHGVDAERYHVVHLSSAPAAKTYGRSIDFSIGVR